MLGLSRGVITGLVASGFVSPERGARNAYRFTFQDVVLLRTAVELQAANIPPRKILSALKKLRATLPDEMPLSGLRLSAVGSDVTVRDGGSQWQAETGQLVMDFEVVPDRGTVAPFKRSAQVVAIAPPAGAEKKARARPFAAPLREDVTAVFSRGEALEASDPMAAEAAYRKVIAIDPDHADAYLNLGALLCEGRRCREAVALYDQALKRHPAQALLHFNRAIALEDQGRNAEALASYHESLRLEPDLADAHYNAARLHEQLGDAKQAVRHFSAYRRLQRPH